MTTAYTPGTRFFRFLAYAIFALYGLTAALVCLWLAFPLWGANPTQVYVFYVAPQGYAAALTLAFALLVSAVTGFIGLVHSLIRRRGNWAVVYFAALALALQGPLIFSMSSTDYRSVSLTQGEQSLAGIASCIAFLALPILALVFARHLRRVQAGPVHAGRPPVVAPIHDGT